MNLEIFGRERVGAIGRTGSGKSHLLMRALGQIKGRDVIVVDTKGSVRNRPAQSRHESEVFLQGYSITKDWKRAAAAYREGGKVIYRPTTPTPPDEFWTRVWNEYGGTHKRNLTLYVEEAGHITGVNKIPDGLQLIFQAGREVGLGCWWGAQQSTKVHNTVLSQSEKHFIFHIPVESDRDKLKGILGKGVLRAGELDRFEFIPFGFPEISPVASEGTILGSKYRLED